MHSFWRAKIALGASNGVWSMEEPAPRQLAFREKIRRQGRSRFIVMWGLLFFGLPSGILFYIAMSLLAWHEWTLAYLSISITNFLFVGWIGAAWVWWFLSSQRKVAEKK